MQGDGKTPLSCATLKSAGICERDGVYGEVQARCDGKQTCELDQAVKLFGNFPDDEQAPSGYGEVATSCKAWSVADAKWSVPRPFGVSWACEPEGAPPAKGVRISPLDTVVPAAVPLSWAWVAPEPGASYPADVMPWAYDPPEVAAKLDPLKAASVCAQAPSTQQIHLVCPANGKLVVEKATLGKTVGDCATFLGDATCEHDGTAAVSKQCDGQQKCTFDGFAGGGHTTMVALDQFDGCGGGGVGEHVICAESVGHEALTLDCAKQGDGKGVIDVQWANYGKHSGSCAKGSMAPDSGCAIDGRVKLRDLCQGKAKCTVQAWDLWPDPCPGAAKDVLVRYACGAATCDAGPAGKDLVKTSFSDADNTGWKAEKAGFSLPGGALFVGGTTFSNPQGVATDWGNSYLTSYIIEIGKDLPTKGGIDVTIPLDALGSGVAKIERLQVQAALLAPMPINSTLQAGLHAKSANGGAGGVVKSTSFSQTVGGDYNWSRDPLRLYAKIKLDAVWDVANLGLAAGDTVRLRGDLSGHPIHTSGADGALNDIRVRAFGKDAPWAAPDGRIPAGWAIVAATSTIPAG